MARIPAFEQLNPEQRAAAAFGDHKENGAFCSDPLLIIAGAGTGKTNTLAHRVAHLVLEGVSPEAILLLTFTRRAAQEMTLRAQRIVSAVLNEKAGDAKMEATPMAPAVKLPWSGTFHSIANRLIRLHCARVALDANFSVLDRGDAADLMDVLRHELKFSESDRRFPRKDTCLAIYSHRVNAQSSLAATLAGVFPWCAEWEQELTRLYQSYVERKLAQQALDYDDLLLYWHVMLQDAALAEEMGSKFEHILVDEYQDTNRLQADILQALRPSGSGLTVVGDDAQAIYSFRAASVENILSFGQRYGAGAKVLTLEENYRSTQRVLDVANALIAEGQRQYRKTLRSRRGHGERPRYVTIVDDQAQAHYVVTHILQEREAGIALKRQAVLFRSSHHSDLLELELVRRSIPYVKYGGLKFLEAAHVKDLLAVLRWADNPKNRISAFRAVQLLPGMGPANAGRCFNSFEASGHAWGSLGTFAAPPPAAESWPQFAELLKALGPPDASWEGQVGRVREWFEPHLERIYEASETRLGDLIQLERISQQFPTRERFLTELALDLPRATSDVAGSPLLDEDYLVLSTIHSAKGQEWGVVYVLNVADGNFPSEFSTGDAELIEEERRLLYVAITRAKTSLHLLAPLRYYVSQQPRAGDAHVYGARSRFITPAVLEQLEQVTWPKNESETLKRGGNAPQVDVAGTLRGMWTAG